MRVKRYFSLLILTALMAFGSCFAQLMHPFNLDFEEGQPGKMPRGWDLTKPSEHAGYTASLTASNPYEGRYCLGISCEGEYKAGKFGSVIQTIDAAQYRGRRIRLTAAIRADIKSKPGSAHLWITERTFDKQEGFHDAMDNFPITSNEWKIYTIEGQITEDAQVLNFGLMLKGTGSAWIDKASLEIINENATAWLPPSALSEKGAENIAAFAKLMGYVRYFCPSIEAQSVNWNKFAYYGVKYVEKAQDKNELADRLNTLFKPLAPALVIYKDTKKHDVGILSAPANAMKKVALAWKHVGPRTEAESKMFTSAPVNVYNSQREKEGAVTQILDAAAFRGKHVVFSSAIKANVIAPAGQAQLWLRVDNAEEKMLTTATMFDKPATRNKWSQYSIEADIPQDAKFLRLGLVLFGEGEAWFDDTKLTVESGKEKGKAEPRNADFEEGEAGKVVFGWRVLPASETSGYTASIIDKNAFSGKHCLYINSDAATRINMPVPGETVSSDLDGGLSFSMPVALYVDSSHTLPYPPRDAGAIDYDKEVKSDYSAKDRTSRLAITASLWNIFRHFSLSRSAPEAWDKALKEALEHAATDTSELQFVQSLRLLLPALNDAQARVWHESEEYRYGLPFLMKWVKNELVITNVLANVNDIKPGDIITEIEGTPAAKYLEEQEHQIGGASQDLKHIRAIAALRAGVQASKVRLKVKNSSGNESEKEFERSAFMSDLAEKRPAPVSLLKPGIFYVDLTRLSDNDIKKVLDTLRPAKSIIFDTRGIMLSSEHLLGFFSKENLKSLEWRLPVFTMPLASQVSYRILTNDIKSRPIFGDKKCLFLADSRTIGYAEGMLAIAKKYNIGGIVGMPTAGAAGEIFGFRLPAGYNASMTAIYGFDQDGSMIFSNPVQPTVTAEPTPEGLAAGRDEVLEKAVSMLEK